MAVEVFSNNASSTLNGGIDNVTTTVVVNSASSFPATPNFRILIDAEYMLVTAVAGATFTVTRGVEGSGAASHSNAAPVTHLLTAGGLAQTVKDVSTDGAWTGLSGIYQNGWADFGGGFQVGQYMKDRTGRVWLRGLMAPGTTTGGTVIFTLPSGFRPQSTVLFSLIINGGGSACRFDLASSGTMTDVTGGAASFIGLDPISFSVN